MNKFKNIVLTCLILFLFSIGSSKPVNAQTSECKWQNVECPGGWWTPGRTIGVCLVTGTGTSCSCGQATHPCSTLSDSN